MKFTYTSQSGQPAKAGWTGYAHIYTLNSVEDIF
jgi:hypothetical protein